MMFNPGTWDLDVATIAGHIKNPIVDVDSESIEELRDERGGPATSKEIDLGWGETCLVMSWDIHIRLFKNMMIIMDSCSSEGIEVWVTLEEQVMDLVKCNSELLSFAILLQWIMAFTLGANPEVLIFDDVRSYQYANSKNIEIAIEFIVISLKKEDTGDGAAAILSIPGKFDKL
ncbi:transferase, Chloramphenicol acetyltransferase-like domain protein [Artemisia annua]|uniref:Transferase, Chloramphenicol acetyltransferase-like domain protein n=1 Tax=Artemisia annua TaxID=35608 RepID=A0A2U1NKK3_ARTAN|nr:transferase, Chloramphenicol acetyltransferase-like domain protein [Artemisia annua]